MALPAIGCRSVGEERCMQKATPATTALARQGRPQSLPTMPTTALPCLASLVFTALPAAGRRGCPRLARRYGRPAGISR